MSMWLTSEVETDFVLNVIRAGFVSTILAGSKFNLQPGELQMKMKIPR